MSDKFTVLFAGRRGVPGLKGDKGDQGDPGRSINMRGIWASGTTYAPGDAVTDDSTAAQGIFSLFVQRDTAPSSVSNTSPRLDPGRWSEVGATDLSNVTGAIWRVVQNAHGFTGVGQPVTFSQPANRWVLATNSLGQPSAVAVVREIISPNEVILQGSGEISGLDPAIITPGPAAQFTPGRFYYASSAPGFLTESPTVSAVNFTSNAMLLATGPTSGVVLQWQATPNTVGLRPVAMNSFFYDAAPGQTIITGVDLDGNTLAYTTADQMRVLVGGVDVSGFDGFTATTGTSVTLATALVGGERIEVRVLAEPLAALVPGTAAVVDSIQTLFDGAARRFPLTVGAGTAVTLGPAQNVLVWLDGNAQEPNVDYLIVAGVSTASDIEFSVAPAPGTRFWAIVGLPTANALPAIASFTDLTVTNLLRATAFETANAQISGPISGTAVTQSETDGTAGRVVRVQDGDIRYGQQFDTRAAYTAWVAAGGVAVNGRTYSVAGLPYRGLIGATVTGLAGLIPHPSCPLTPDHFGANTTPGTTDMTAAIQAAVNYAATATDKLVRLLPAIYFVSSTITINADGVSLMGDSEFSSTIRRTGNYGDTIFVTGNDATGVVVQSNEVSNIRFISAGLTTSGAHIRWNGTFKSNMRGVDFQNGFVAVRFSGATNMHVERVRAIWSNLFGGVVTGRRFFLFDSAASTYGHPHAGDVFVDSFNLRTNGDNPNVEVGCEIKSADGIWFVNGHYGGASLANFWLNAVDASQHIGLVFNSAVMFDANAGDGIRFSGSAQIGRNIYFAGCNLKGGAIGQYGINVVSGASFTNVNWNGGFITEYLLNGVLINSASAVNWTFTDVNIRGNSYNSPGTSHGVSVINGTSFQFLGGRYGGHNINQTPATQGYGIVVGASASNVFVHGVDLRGNTVAPSLVNGLALNVKFSDCISDRTRTIASASSLDLPRELQTHVVTGTTTINNMIAQPEGSQVTLQFQAALSISGAGNLSPGTAITTAANQILTFQCDGTNWRRVT